MNIAATKQIIEQAKFERNYNPQLCETSLDNVFGPADS